MYVLYSTCVRETRRLRRSIVPLLALAASVTLHVALGVLALSRRAVPPPPGQVAWVEVELRPALPAPSPPAPVAIDVPPPAQAAPSQRLRSPRRAARADAGAAPSGEAVASEGRNPLAGLEADRRAGAPDLRPRWPSGTFAADALGVGEAGDRTPRDALGDWAREQAGRRRVEDGLVHPYFQDVGRALLRAWDVEQTVRRRGLPGYLAQAGENVRAFGRVWQRLAAGYGASGAPALVDGSSARMKELSGLPAGPARDALVGQELRRQLRPELSKGHLTLVRVTQALDGRLRSVELVSPSQDAAIDRAAIEGVREAAQDLPVPPEEARVARDTLVSLWEFQLEVSITPPLPVIAFEFDEVLGVTDVRLPLDRRLWKQVRLVAIY